MRSEVAKIILTTTNESTKEFVKEWVKELTNMKTVKDTKPLNQMEEKIKQLIAELEKAKKEIPESSFDEGVNVYTEVVIKRLNNILKGEVMEKESLILLQKIDCNCNNCLYMVRDFDKYSESLSFHEKMQLDAFNGEVSRMKAKAKEWKDEKGDLEKWDNLLREAEKMKFQFDKSTASINYGTCSKLVKDVSFIPNTCQLETQNCF